MPRRRQGHFHVVRRANSISKTRSTIYNEEGKLSQPEVIATEESIRSKDGGDSKMPRCKSKGNSKANKEFLWKVDENLTIPGQQNFCYLHKKFKKMETSSEGDEFTAADQGVKENGGNAGGGEPTSRAQPASRPANFSLEALFQVTGHELEKINSSSQDSDSSELVPLDARHKRQNVESEAPGEKKIKMSEAQSTGTTQAGFGSPKEAPEDDGFAEERQAAKRLKLGRHVCPYCGLGCGKPSVLQKHIRAHTNERPYPCVPCGFAFKTKSNLYKHCKSRAHHLKASNEPEACDKMDKLDGEKPESMERFKIASGDPGAEADVIETEESSASDGNPEEDDEDEGDSAEERQNSVKEDSPILRPLNYSPTSSNVFPAICAQAEETSTPAIPTSIYKPKFHSVPYNAPAPRAAQMPTRTESPASAQTTCGSSRGSDSGPFTNAASLKMIACHDSKVLSPSVAESKLSPGVSLPENCTVISLAKRRNDQFQLRLEIPQPRPFVGGLLGSCSSSSSSSSSISSIPAIVTSSAVYDRLPNMVVTSSSSMLTTSSSCRPSIGYRGDSPAASSPALKSPKLTSPEYLQQHISKLISQNAAIVETLDPLWPRRYTRQSSIASSHNVDAELRSKERLRRYSEDVARPPFPPKSKLALALLASPSTPASTGVNTSVAHLLSEKSEHNSCAVKPVVQPSRVTAAPLAENSVPKDARKSASEGDGVSLVRSLLLADQPKQNADEKSGRKTKTDIHHPQNPEGSIIKDLLLKTRTVSKPGQNSSCMRLSGGSISSSTADKYGGSTVLPVKDSSAERREKGGSGEPPYFCSSCNISYRSAENLEVHRNLYCSNAGPKVSTSAMSGGSFTLPTSPLEVRLDDVVVTSSSGGPVQDLAVLSHKPRGRPRGSKNRPKMEMLPNAGVVNRIASRIHSKSVSEFAGENLEGHDITLDALKGKLNYRRNSVSGDVMDSAMVSPMTRNNFSNAMVKCSDEKSDDDGPILKKHLLAGVLSGDRSPPLKKRKINDEFMAPTISPTKSGDGGGSNSKRDNAILSLKSLEQLSKYPMKASAVHLFGGEVQICDGAETKKFVIDSKIQSSTSGSVLGDLRNSDSTTSAVVATIAKPVHNSGGTVLQVQDSKMSLNKPVCIPVVSIGRPLMATGSGNVRTSMSGSIILPSATASSAQPFAIDISHLKLLNPNPILVKSPSLNSILPPVLIPFPSEPSEAPETNVSKPGTGGKKDAATPSHFNAKRSLAKDLVPQCSSQISKVPLIAVHSPKSPMAAIRRDDDVTIGRANEAAVATTTTASKTFLSPPRPTTLALKNVHTSSVGMTLVSPETPRPEKKYGQCYHNGQYYTYLEFKQSTRVYYCNCHPQPMYVPQSVDPKLSMYSMWQTVPAVPDPFGLTPPQAMGLYVSKPRSAAYSVAKPAITPLVVTHSSYWTFQQRDKSEAPTSDEDADARKIDEKGEFSEADEEIEGFVTQPEDEDAEEGEREALRTSRETMDEESEEYGRLFAAGVKLKDDSPLAYRLKEALEIGGHEPRRVKIFEGGFKSNEDYTYVRGRGRGKYVCEECGIRCKKPSMLKKHIRTHTDVRPYTCKHCNFSFKTKGNLTKHMKSKAHHKKCVELGIVPVPVTIDDAQIDEEALARQERIEHQRKQFADVDEDSAFEEDDDDEDDDDEEEEEELEGYKEGENEDDESMELEGQFEDASESPIGKCQTVEGIFRKGYPEQEIARSLLELGKPDVTLGLPSSPLLLADVRSTSDGLSLNRMITCDGSKRDVANDERDELIGNPRVVWSSQRQSESDFHHARLYGLPYIEMSEQVQENLVQLNSKDHLALAEHLADNQNGMRQSSFVSIRDDVIACDVDDPPYPQRPLAPPRDACSPEDTDEEADQPIDLSMPHPRPDEQRWDEEEDIVVDDDDEDEAEPMYYSYPAYEEGKQTKEREINGCSPQTYENISPAGSSDCLRDVVRVNPLSAPPHSPYGEEGSEEDRGGCEDVEGDGTVPKGPGLQSYFSELSPVKKANAEKAGESTSNSGFPVKASAQLLGPSTHFPHAPRFGYPASPPSQLEGLPEPSLHKLPADRIVRLPPVTIHNMPLYIHRSMDDGKCICTICNKAFSKPSQLRLHVNIHYFERPFRCDSCAISFRTKGHLQKHKRSVSHYNKVNMNMTFGTPTTDNPRPFKCDDCKIAFRIHGHLAKHLRSKMHIMKLECLGKLPFGTYAEIERSGANLNEIDTTDCENSLESLQVMAHRLVDKVASSSVPCWSRERTISGGSCDDHSDGVPYIESPLPMVVTNSLPTGTPLATGVYGGRSLSGDGCPSPDLTDVGHVVAWNRKSVERNVAPSPESEDATTAVPPNVKREPKTGIELPHCPTTLPSGAVAADGDAGADPVPKIRSAAPPLVQEYEDISDEEESRAGSLNVPKIGCISSCRICGKTLKSAKFLQLHMYVDHAESGAAPEAVSREAGVSSSTSAPNHSNNNSKRRRISSSHGTFPNAVVELEYGCKICGEIYPNGHSLKQHMLIHAKLRPYVCELCDAGFTDPHFLKLHSLHSHGKEKSFECQECSQVFGMVEELERHVIRAHPGLVGDRVR